VSLWVRPKQATRCCTTPSRLGRPRVEAEPWAGRWKTGLRRTRSVRLLLIVWLAVLAITPTAAVGAPLIATIIGMWLGVAASLRCHGAGGCRRGSPRAAPRIAAGAGGHHQCCLVRDLALVDEAQLLESQHVACSRERGEGLHVGNVVRCVGEAGIEPQ
jgi:hypothetical protein